MNFELKTEHLLLRSLIESDAPLLLEFCKRNRDFFKPYEPEHPENFFTEDFQRLLINGFSQQFLKLQSARYYIFENGHENMIIGCVGLSDIKLGDERSAKLLYKIDRSYCGHGYAVEASKAIIAEASRSLGLHRIEADILPGNTRSERVIEKLGFEYEGLARLVHKTNGKWSDHKRYAIILN